MNATIVADLLRTNLAVLTPAEQQIARALQADYPRAGLETAVRLAQRV